MIGVVYLKTKEKSHHKLKTSIMGKKILVVAPHPDDEILGCGGTIKKYLSAGNRVFILIMSRGKKELYSDEKILNVRREAEAAHSILGVTGTRFLDFPAPDLDTIPISEISEAIRKVIVELNINTLYLPHYGDIHHDHKIVFNAGLVAARPVNGNPVRSIYTYETLSETEWGTPEASSAFTPTCYENISGFFDSKVEAMKCYKSQLKEFPNPRSLKNIESLATYRGASVGFTFAEAFMVIRIINE